MTDTGLVAGLAHFFSPWQSLYAGSKVVETAVVSVHLVALLFGGGLAVAADRALLRSLRTNPEDRRHALNQLRLVHRPVLVGLGAQFVSGLALTTADINTFAHSTVFLIKLSLVTLLCINGVFLFRTEQALQAEMTIAAAGSRSYGEREQALWGRMRATAWLSLTLWACTVVAGIALVNSA